MNILFSTSILNAIDTFNLKNLPEGKINVNQTFQEVANKIAEKETTKLAIKKLENLNGDYNKGFKYYKKYLKKYLGKGSESVKKAELDSKDKIAELLISLINSNIKTFKKNLEAKSIKSNKKFEIKLKKLQIKKIANIYQFLVGILNGKIPNG